MGNWGYESCSGDGCWDALHEGEHIDDIFDFTQEQSEKCLDALAAKGLNNTWDRHDYLGCVIHILTYEKMVKDEHLVLAKQTAQDLLDDPEHIESWRNPEARRAALRNEIIVIEHAQANGGKAKIEPAKGLLEKMTDALDGDGCANV